MSAPKSGQRFTANGKAACCPVCGSADLTLAVAAESGVFKCRDCGESFIRRYADVTPQSSPPCPVEWCTRRHDPDEPAQADDHVSANRAAPDAFLALYHPYREDRLCLLFGSGGSETATIRLFRSAEARMLATVTIEPVATALRKAADELDRINGTGA